MKRFLAIALLIFVTCLSASAAPATVNLRENCENLGYAKLVRTVQISLSASTGVCWTDVVSSYTNATSMSGSVEMNYPIELVITPASTGDNLYVAPYTSSGTTIVLPTAASHKLLLNYPTVGTAAAWRRRFSKAPDFILWNPSTGTCTVAIWSLQP